MIANAIQHKMGDCIGILSSFKRGCGAEMISTQLHLRAASQLAGPCRDPRANEVEFCLASTMQAFNGRDQFGPKRATFLGQAIYVSGHYI
jgi:hypothetical protein